MLNFKLAMVSVGVAFLSGSLYANATVGETVEDTGITTKIKASLLADSDISSLGISVETNKGVVTLTGCTQTKTQMDKAENDVKTIDGVKSIDNKLTICNK